VQRCKVWLDHYIHQGVDHFYLIDNNSDDNPLEILQPYIDKGIVTYQFRPEKHHQLQIYKDTIIEKDLKNNTEWLIVCDLDEFFYGHPNKLSDTVDEYSKYDVIYSNWKMFGSDGHIEHPKSILKNILWREPTLHELTKYICKPNKINLDDVTIHSIDSENSIIVNDKIQLNHYPIQSEEFFKKVKMSRGDVAENVYENVRDMNYFNRYNENKTVKDEILSNITSQYDKS